MNPFYPTVAERAGYRCEYCHAPEEAFNFPFEVEHIVPIAHGGSHDLDNLALACRACNTFKASFEVGLDTETQMAAQLFQPRQDIWENHFQVNLENAEIIGVSAIGRATIQRLQMNLPRQIRGRLRWMQAALFP